MAPAHLHCLHIVRLFDPVFLVFCFVFSFVWLGFVVVVVVRFFVCFGFCLFVFYGFFERGFNCEQFLAFGPSPHFEEGEIPREFL